ncbi:gamma-glutamyltranspeptidase / glutathione hydrolase [Enhydrobacter aerosaccus]|uniref:Glutathione hydrolase proenzyme n=1 Tax=Enhydrobacter aerosaccus TaxID=225324 RepID=A0A1T4PGM4_9HYPH|nr:gamma-glutamyltransferase [Enhydrobacter aerosaccus]SJZ90714.1 gamma-glutamyltranspeptidase / glutathione hydrolase [Enhydrobacter aerosaccus]
MTLRRFLFAFLILVATAASAAAQRATLSRSMVAAAHPLAVEAGLEVLRKGGSAVDAAVAVQMALGVVEPQASGIGGGGFLLYYDGTSHAITVYDGREAAPAGATPNLFLAADASGTLKPLPFREAVASGLSVGVPGAVALLELAHKEHGKLAWKDLFPSAIRLAQEGYSVSPRLAAWLEIITGFRNDPAARSIFYNADGGPKKVGDRVVNPALADTMRLIAAQGAKALYEGPIAEEIVAHVHAHVRPGTLSLADLADYHPIKREALCGPYRVWIVCGMPPPSSGGLAVLEALELLEPFKLSQDKPDDLRSLHLIAEASRLAFADRDRYVGDPAFVDVPVAKLLAPAYIAQRRKLISLDRSMGKVGPGDPSYPEHGTSHMTIVDRWGNAVSFTTTIEAPFGAQMMVRGFILNNELTDFSAQPEIDGRLVANRVQPGKRPRSSMSPTLVLDKDRRLVAAVGSAGGSRIIGDTLQALIGMLDWNLAPQEAVSLPRILNMNGPTILEDVPALTAQADALRALGHEVQVSRLESGLTAIRRVGDGWEGGADPRRDGVAKGE